MSSNYKLQPAVVNCYLLVPPYNNSRGLTAEDGYQVMLIVC